MGRYTRAMGFCGGCYEGVVSVTKTIRGVSYQSMDTVMVELGKVFTENESFQ